MSARYTLFGSESWLVLHTLRVSMTLPLAEVLPFFADAASLEWITRE